MWRQLTGTLIACSVWTSSHAGFTVIKSFDEWSSAAGDATTLDFVFPEEQVLTDQYASLGAFFVGGEIAFNGAPSSLRQDGWGCISQFGTGMIHVKFSQPIVAIGAWFPGVMTADLYLKGLLIYSSPELSTFGADYQFGGIVSSQPFDEVILKKNSSLLLVDDILFAPPVPAPGAAGIVGIGWLCLRRRRARAVGDE